MAPTSLQEEPHKIDDQVSSSSDDEYYYEYEIVEDSIVEEDNKQPETLILNQKYKRLPSNASFSVETVGTEEEDDDYDYEEVTCEEEILEEVIENPEETMESTIVESTTTESPSMMKPPPPSTKPPPPPPSSAPNPIPDYVPSPFRKAPSPVKQSKFLMQGDVLSPSQQRAKAANSEGLSELSKQLRVLQAKNESQAVDINRLERQLRILADLQGISVADLRKALEQACASEAFGELQHTVAKLKYELEAATLLKQAELRKDAAAPYIANLELKVGELEEVEEKQQLEIRSLYEGLREERAKSTQYESENQKLKKALQDTIEMLEKERLKTKEAEETSQKQMQEMREKQAKMMLEQAASVPRSTGASESEQSKSGSATGVLSPEMAAEYQKMVQLVKKKDEELRIANAKLHADEIRRAQELKEAEERSREAQMKIKVEADKMALTVKELEDADGQNGLRLAQFKARFAVQNERIIDQNQQLSSLYTAFDLYKEEFDSERENRDSMMRNLKDADEKVARQTNEMEEKKAKSTPRQTRSRTNRESHGFPPSSSVPNQSFPSYVNTHPAASAKKSAVATRAPVSPATPVSYRTPQSYVNDITPYSPSNPYSNYSVDLDDTPATYATAKEYKPIHARTPTTWDIIRDRDTRSRVDEGLEGQLISGPLIVESNSVLRKWKSKPSRIYLRGEGYQWDIGEKRSFPIKFGVSKVEFHPNYPLSFSVSLDPTSLHAPTIRAATSNEYDYHRWIAALYKATTGEEYQGGLTSPSVASSAVEAKSPSPSDDFAPLRSPSRSTATVSRTEQEDAEDEELQQILELSKYEK